MYSRFPMVTKEGKELQVIEKLKQIIGEILVWTFVVIYGGKKDLRQVMLIT